ncbi:MAG: hypothetical protein ACXWC9_03730, partial [Pseudobdellovibrionaceae bacterium]
MTPAAIDSIYSDLQQAKRSIDDLRTEEIAEIEQTVAALDQGKIRVCEKTPAGYQTHQWVKK